MAISLLSSLNPHEIHTNTLGLLAYPSFRSTHKDPTQKSPNTDTPSLTDKPSPVVNMLKKRLEGSHGKWAEELHVVFWAYRTTQKTATGETPYSLVYGSVAIVTTEMHVRTTVSGSTSQEEKNELMALSLDLLDEKREAARLRNGSYHQDVARTYNKRVRTRTFQQGDWVLRRAEKTTGKLTSGWEGPYKVIEVRRAGAYRLQDSKSKIQPNCWNVLHFKAYHF